MQMRGLKKKISTNCRIRTGNRSSSPPRVELHLSHPFLGKFSLKALFPSSNPVAKPDTRQFSGAIWRLKPSTGQLALSQIPSKGASLPCSGTSLIEKNRTMAMPQCESSCIHFVIKAHAKLTLLSPRILGIFHDKLMTSKNEIISAHISLENVSFLENN